jgi:CheY-like chemotaxis protein
LTTAGVGIPKEHLSEIFDPYYTTKEHGHGLGLATSYSIIEKHQGHISADSQPGTGTTLSVYLPAGVEGAPAPRLKERDLTPEKGSGTVLVMDDEGIVHEVARMGLELLGYGYARANDGNQAVDLYQEAMKAGTPYVVVIMDLTVPGGMGGTEALKLLRKLDPDVRAIVSSGYSNTAELSEYRKLGFKDVLRKPYDVPQLTDVLSRVLTPPPEAPAGA